jgi:hypothetical protein
VNCLATFSLDATMDGSDRGQPRQPRDAGGTRGEGLEEAVRRARAVGGERHREQRAFAEIGTTVREPLPHWPLTLLYASAVQKQPGLSARSWHGGSGWRPCARWTAGLQLMESPLHLKKSI